LNKKVIGIVLLLLCVLAAYFGYVKYAEHKLIESLSPHVKNTSLRLANTLSYETDTTNATFLELFSKLESEISEIDKRLLEVQTIASPANKATTDVVIDYIKSGKELLRAELNASRKQLAIVTAQELKNQMQEACIKSDSPRAGEYPCKTYYEARESLGKANSEAKEAITGFLTSLKKMDKSRVQLSELMAADCLLDSTVLKKFIDPIDTKFSADLQRSKRYTANDNSTVTDNQTGLMWAATDNGAYIKWPEAKAYCENYQAGGYTNWRMPTQDELAGLYDKEESEGHTPLIKISDEWVWGSEMRGSEVAIFNIQFNMRHWTTQYNRLIQFRALPVRSSK
jgi:hypothetical protein